MATPLRNGPDTPRRVRECERCGMAVDSEAETCTGCGLERPAAGWAPLRRLRAGRVGRPARPDDAPGLQVAPPNPSAERKAGGARIYVGGSGERPSIEEFDMLGVGTIVDIGHPAIEAEDVGSRALAPGQLYAARYRLEEHVSASPSADRHLAVQEPLVRRVVLTVLLPDLAPDLQVALEGRFLQEAAALGRLRHPCLAPVHDTGRAPDRSCYFTEELLYGPTLFDLEEHGALPPDRALGIVADVTSALCAMHEMKVAHRCLRADRVVISPWGWRGGGREVAQVSRYGLEVTPEGIRAEQDAESVLCWPPEVLAGQEADEAADLYAVGVLLYRALSGRPPYPGAADEVRAARAAGDPAPLARPGDRWMGDALSALAERCLRASPEDRFPSARALLAELERIAALPRPVAPAPPPVVVPAPPVRLPLSALVVAGLAGAVLPTAVLFALGLRLDGPSTGLLSPPAPPARVEVAKKEVPPADPPPAIPLATDSVGASSAPSTPPADAVALPTAAPPPTAAPVAAAPPSSAPPAAAPAPKSYASRRGTRPSATAAPVAPAEPVSAPAPEPAPTPVAAAPAVAPSVVAATPIAAPEPAEPAPAPVAAAPTPAPSGQVVAGASGLSGLWLGRAGGETFALDLVVSSDGRVTGRLKRSESSTEAPLEGHVSRSADGIVVELQVTEGGITSTYSGALDSGELRGRIYSGGKAQGRFTARR